MKTVGKVGKIVLPFLLTLGSITLFFLLFKPQQAFSTLARVSLPWMGLSLLSSIISISIIRPWIWKYYFSRNKTNATFLQIFQVLSISSFYAIFLPARSGEPVSAYLFHRKTNASISSLLAFALYEKILHFFSSGLIFLGAFMMTRSSHGAWLETMRPVLGGNIRGTSIFWVVGLIMVSGLIIWRLLSKKLLKFIQSLREIFHDSPLLLTTTGLSLVYLTFGIFGNMAVIFSFPQEVLLPGFNVFPIVAMMVCFSIFSSVISIFPTGLGPGEFGYAAFLVLIGFSPEFAALIVLTNTAVSYLIAIVAFLLGMFLKIFQ